MRLNTVSRKPVSRTHEGAIASRITPFQELRRSVLSCMLWEDTFYESGESIAERIKRNALIVPPDDLAALAIEARHKFHLRHVPLLLLTQLVKTGRGIPGLTKQTIGSVISRADEMAEFLSIFWEGKSEGILPYSIIKGLQIASQKFDAYQLRKYDRDGDITLRDVLFQAHIKFPDDERAKLAANIVNRTYFPEETLGGYRVKQELGLDGAPHLDPPETWEALIAAVGSDKPKRRLIWEDMLRKNLEKSPGGLGYMAVLRNLRNMTEDGVNNQLINQVIEARIGARKVLPFRFIQAAKVTPQFFRALDNALKGCVVSQEGLEGETAVCVDCSGSMQSPVSGKSQVSRFEAAAALAGCINGHTRLVAFGQIAKEIMPLQGLACIKALETAGVGYATNAHLAVELVHRMNPPPKRIIVISDEQVTQILPPPKMQNAYVINVASYQNGIGYERYTKIDGFAPATLDYIREIERGD